MTIFNIIHHRRSSFAIIRYHVHQSTIGNHPSSPSSWRAPLGGAGGDSPDDADDNGNAADDDDDEDDGEHDNADDDIADGDLGW